MLPKIHAVLDGSACASGMKYISRSGDSLPGVWFIHREDLKDVSMHNPGFTALQYVDEYFDAKASCHHPQADTLERKHYCELARKRWYDMEIRARKAPAGSADRHAFDLINWMNKRNLKLTDLHHSNIGLRKDGTVAVRDFGVGHGKMEAQDVPYAKHKRPRRRSKR
jgi:hypothetical protein